MMEVKTLGNILSKLEKLTDKIKTKHEESLARKAADKIAQEKTVIELKEKERQIKQEEDRLNDEKNTGMN